MEVVTLEIALERILEPSDLPHLLAKAEEKVPAAGKEVVMLSGRLPVWAYVALGHLYHPRPAVATYEPRLDAGVVVASHIRQLEVGDLIHPLDGARRVEIRYP